MSASTASRRGAPGAYSHVRTRASAIPPRRSARASSTCAAPSQVAPPARAAVRGRQEAVPVAVGLDDGHHLGGRCVGGQGPDVGADGREVDDGACGVAHGAQSRTVRQAGRTTTSARSAVAATSRALRSSGPCDHARAASGRLAERLVPRHQPVQPEPVVGRQEPRLVEQVRHRAEPVVVEQQVVPLHDHEPDLGRDRDGARHRVAQVAAVLGRVDGPAPGPAGGSAARRSRPRRTCPALPCGPRGRSARARSARGGTRPSARRPRSARPRRPPARPPSTSRRRAPRRCRGAAAAPLASSASTRARRSGVRRHASSSSAIVPGSASATAARGDRAAGVGAVRRATVHQRGRRGERGGERRVVVHVVHPARQQGARAGRPARRRRPPSPATPARRPGRRRAACAPATTVTGPLSRTVAPVSSWARRAQRSGSASTAAPVDVLAPRRQHARQLARVRREHRVRADVRRQQLQGAGVDHRGLPALQHVLERVLDAAALPGVVRRDPRPEHPRLHPPVADDDLRVRPRRPRPRRRPGTAPSRRPHGRAAPVVSTAAPGYAREPATTPRTPRVYLCASGAGTGHRSATSDGSSRTTSGAPARLEAEVDELDPSRGARRRAAAGARAWRRRTSP